MKWWVNSLLPRWQKIVLIFVSLGGCLVNKKLALAFKFEVCPHVFGLVSVIVSTKIQTYIAKRRGPLWAVVATWDALVSRGKWLEPTLLHGGVSCAFGSHSAHSFTNRCEPWSPPYIPWARPHPWAFGGGWLGPAAAAEGRVGRAHRWGFWAVRIQSWQAKCSGRCGSLLEFCRIKRKES